jgi:hypothetical protein
LLIAEDDVQAWATRQRAIAVQSARVELFDTGAKLAAMGRPKSLFAHHPTLFGARFAS